MIGVALRRAASRTSRPGRWAWASARGSAWRRGMSASPRSGRRLGAVLAAALLAVADAGGIEGAPDDVVLHRREVADAATADEHDGVLLEVVADPRDVGRDLHLVREAHARDLPQRGVRLARRHRPDLEADTALLRGARNGDLLAVQPVPVRPHGRRLDLRDLAGPAVAHELADRRHEDAAPFGLIAAGGGPPAVAGGASAQARGTLLGWSSRRVVDAASTADPSRGHERGVYQRPENGVKPDRTPPGDRITRARPARSDPRFPFVGAVATA